MKPTAPISKTEIFQGKSAFTLIEVIIAVAILTLTLIFLFLNINAIRSRNALSTSAEQVVYNLRSAHISAREAKEQKSWGIVVGSQDYSFVKGDSSEPWELVKKITLIDGISFVSAPPGPIWFEIGTGEVGSDIKITLKNKLDMKIDIEILKSGVVDLGREYK